MKLCSGRSFPFLNGVNPDTVSFIENEESVFDMVYSQSSGLIYVVVSPQSISGFKWDESKKKLSRSSLRFHL